MTSGPHTPAQRFLSTRLKSNTFKLILVPFSCKWEGTDGGAQGIQFQLKDQTFSVHRLLMPLTCTACTQRHNMYPKARPVNLRYGAHLFSLIEHFKSFLSFCYSDQMSQVSKARAATIEILKYKFQLVHLVAWVDALCSYFCCNCMQLKRERDSSNSFLYLARRLTITYGSCVEIQG